MFRSKCRSSHLCPLRMTFFKNNVSIPKNNAMSSYQPFSDIYYFSKQLFDIQLSTVTFYATFNY